MTELMFRDNQQVSSQRILYTPSAFARECLIHLQEVGILKALSAHKSQRSNLASYLFFIVLSGEGELKYEDVTYPLKEGDCVFVDCRKAYAHSTESDLWSLRWVHFNGPTMAGVYKKYLERGGSPVFNPDNLAQYSDLLEIIQTQAAEDDYVRDMHLNELLSTLLSLLMQSAWSPIDRPHTTDRHSIADIKEFLDQNFYKKIALDDLAEHFYINKFYLTRLFKERYGSSIISYVLSMRISRAKHLLRFTDLPIEEIGRQCGFEDANYFSRAFRKVEGVTPSGFREMW